MAVVGPLSRADRAGALVVTPGVSTDPGGATVTIDARGTWRESGTSTSSTGCRRVWVPAVAPVYLDRGGTMWNGRHPMPSKPAPDAVAYHVYCGGTYVTSVWLRPSAFLPAPDTTREIALRRLFVSADRQLERAVAAELRSTVVEVAAQLRGDRSGPDAGD